MILRPLLLAVPVAMTALACASSDDPSPARDGGTTTPERDSGPVDPTGGRDEKPESCFASCQNSSFTCQAKDGTTSTLTTVSLQLDDKGCGGKFRKSSDGPETAVNIQLSCLDADVCLGSAPGQAASGCVTGAFSATTFSFTPSGGKLTTCVRD